MEPLQSLVSRLEEGRDVTLVKPPATVLTMLAAEDSLEGQRFFLGEALTTECEVLVDGSTGFGLCLGDEPMRGYCLAVVDALSGDGRCLAEIECFLAEHAEIVGRRERAEFNLILSTEVDFKLMEEE